MSGELHKYFLNNADKKLNKWLHYFDIYEKHLNKFVGESPIMLEIGVQGGGSLDMWKAYFGKGCRIIGLDIDPACKQYESDNIEIFIGDQSDPRIIQEILEKYHTLDIVLDDGSHISKDITSSFHMLYDSVDENGVYLIEDTHGCYFPIPPYYGGVKKEDSFMEFAKDRIDDLHANSVKTCMTDYMERKKLNMPYEPSVNRFSKHTQSISFYDSIVVFEKRKQSERMHITTQGL